MDGQRLMKFYLTWPKMGCCYMFSVSLKKKWPKKDTRNMWTIERNNTVYCEPTEINRIIKSGSGENQWK